MKINFKSLIVIIAGLVLMQSCKKDDQLSTEPNTFGYISVNHAALLVPRPVNVLIDGNRVNNNNFLGYLGSITGNFVGAAQGSRTLAIRDTTAATTGNYVSRNLNVTAGMAYNAFTYGVVNSNTFNMIVLPTSLQAPATDRFNVRFLHLSPDAPPVDVALLRVNDARTAYADSLVIRTAQYVGSSSTPNETNLAALTTLPSGLYHIRVRPAGTFTNVVSVGTSFTTGQTFASSKIYTVFARGLLNNTGAGTSAATALGATVVLHNP